MRQLHQSPPLVAVRLEEDSGVRIVGTPCDVCGRPLRDADPIAWKAGEWGRSCS